MKNCSRKIKRYRSIVSGCTERVFLPDQMRKMRIPEVNNQEAVIRVSCKYSTVRKCLLFPNVLVSNMKSGFSKAKTERKKRAIAQTVG